MVYVPRGWKCRRDDRAICVNVESIIGYGIEGQLNNSSHFQARTMYNSKGWYIQFLHIDQHNRIKGRTRLLLCKRDRLELPPWEQFENSIMSKLQEVLCFFFRLWLIFQLVPAMYGPLPKSPLPKSFSPQSSLLPMSPLPQSPLSPNGLIVHKHSTERAQGQRMCFFYNKKRINRKRTYVGYLLSKTCNQRVDNQLCESLSFIALWEHLSLGEHLSQRWTETSLLKLAG